MYARCDLDGCYIDPEVEITPWGIGIEDLCSVHWHTKIGIDDAMP